MASFGQIKGGEDFAKVQRRLKEAGDKTVTRELNRGVFRAVEPVKESVRDGLPIYLPDRYAAVLEGSLGFTTRKNPGKNPSVRLAGKAKTPQGKKRQLGSLNRGRLRKPVFGNRRNWVNQNVKPGFFDESARKAAPGVRKELQKIAENISRQLKGN